MGFNKETFKSIAPTFYLSSYEKDPEDRIYTRVFRISRYEYNYDHAIVKFMKNSGCKIIRTNWNMWDGNFYVFHTRPKNEVCLDDFCDKYKGGIHLTNRCKVIWFTALFLILLNIVMLCLTLL